MSTQAPPTIFVKLLHTTGSKTFLLSNKKSFKKYHTFDTKMYLMSSVTFRCFTNHSATQCLCCSEKWNKFERFGRKEGTLLFNDALNTFYLRLYGIRHMVKDYSDSERGNPLLPHGILFSICIIPQTGLYIPRPLLHQSWSIGRNEKYLNEGSPWRIDQTTHRTMSGRSYHGATSLSPWMYLSILLYGKWTCFNEGFYGTPIYIVAEKWNRDILGESYQH